MALALRIIIDAGHGGSEPAGNSSAYGGRGQRGVVEKDVTLDIAKHVVARLGGAAALTRSRDRNLTIGARAAKGQRSDVFVSIHANYGAPELSGPEVYVHSDAGRGSRALAGHIARALDRQAGRYGGGADERRAAMAVLNPSAIGQTAACLVEVDYLSNPRGEQRLGDPGERAAIGAAIASAIQQHLASGLAWDLAEAIRTIDPVIDGTSLSSNQKRRLHDLLRILRDNPSADDHYVNGHDHELLRIGPHLSPAQLQVMTSNRVTQDLLQQRHWDTPAHIVESLRLLDERIWQAIQYLARRAATDGAAMAAGLQQLKAWISERQQNPGSIYHAYGDLQDRYEGGAPLHAAALQTELTIRGRDHGRVLINVPHQQPPDTRTLTFRGTADLRRGGGRRLGASLEDPSARPTAPLVTYVELDPYNLTPFNFRWPCSNMLTPGVYEVVLRVEGANDDTQLVIDHSHTIG